MDGEPQRQRRTPEEHAAFLEGLRRGKGRHLPASLAVRPEGRSELEHSAFLDGLRAGSGGKFTIRKDTEPSGPKGRWVCEEPDPQLQMAVQDGVKSFAVAGFCFGVAACFVGFASPNAIAIGGSALLFSLALYVSADGKHSKARRRRWVED